MIWLLGLSVLSGLLLVLLYNKSAQHKKCVAAPAAPSSPTRSHRVELPRALHHRKKHKESPRKQKPATGNQAKHALQVGVIPTQKSPTTCVAISACGQRVATADKSGTVRVFSVGEVSSANLQQVFWGVLDNDFPIAMDFGTTGDCLYLVLDLRRNLCKVKLEKGELNRLVTVFATPPDIHKGVVTWICASRGPFVVTCCRGDDTAIKVWDTSGDLIGAHDTKQVKIHDFAFSAPDARFLGAAAWSSGVQILEVKRKGTNVTKFSKAMDLKTSCGVLAVALSSDHRRAMILKKGGEYSLYDIDVRYEAGERTKVIKDIKEEDETFANANSLSYVANDKLLMAISGPHIKFMNSDTFEVVQLIENAHPSDIVVANVVQESTLLTFCRNNKPRIWRVPDSTFDQ